MTSTYGSAIEIAKFKSTITSEWWIDWQVLLLTWIWRKKGTNTNPITGRMRSGTADSSKDDWRSEQTYNGLKIIIMF